MWRAVSEEISYGLCGKVAELLCGRCDEHDEQDQQEGLCDFEWCLGSGGGERMEGGDVLEGLRDEDKDVEVESDESGDGVGATPPSVEMEDVESEEGNGENNQREDAEDNSRGDFGEGKEEAGDAGQDRCHEEDSVPGFKESAAEHAEEGEESGSDADEADDDVHNGVGCQAHAEDHGCSLSFSLATVEAMLLKDERKKSGMIAEVFLYRAGLCDGTS
jgi:hypothetical protein